MSDEYKTDAKLDANEEPEVEGHVRMANQEPETLDDDEVEAHVKASVKADVKAD
jgi:hypothetical protein